jgi:hypothetical protein
MQDACDARTRLLLLCHPAELLGPESGVLPVVIPGVLSLYKVSKVVYESFYTEDIHSLVICCTLPAVLTQYHVKRYKRYEVSSRLPC